MFVFRVMSSLTGCRRDIWTAVRPALLWSGGKCIGGRGRPKEMPTAWRSQNVLLWHPGWVILVSSWPYCHSQWYDTWWAQLSTQNEVHWGRAGVAIKEIESRTEKSKWHPRPNHSGMTSDELHSVHIKSARMDKPIEDWCQKWNWIILILACCQSQSVG